MASNRRIVILGKTGVGKSSLANTILGKELFKVDDTSSSLTGECRAETRSVNGTSITLIDTPGFFDTERSEEELKCEIVRCIIECAPGPHAFLIVLKVEKFTKQEQAVINMIQQYFSEEVFKYAVVLFTHGDQLKGQTIEEFVHQNKSLSDMVKKCGGRCHVIDNEYWNENPKDEYRSNQFQVKKLLNTLDKITEANKGGCYTNEMLQVVQEIIEQEKMLMRQSSGKMSEEEITKKAKDKAYKDIWIRLAGVGTGAVLGALFGVVVMGGVVVLALKKVVPVAKTVIAAAQAAVAAETAAAALASAIVGGATAGAAAGGAAGAAAGGAAAGGAAAGGAVAAGGATAGGTAAGGAAAGMTTIKLAGAVGAVIGGYKGYNAAEGAETSWEAAEMTATAVKEGAKSIIDRVRDYFDIFSKPPDSK